VNKDEKEEIRVKFFNTFLLNDDSRQVLAYIKKNMIDAPVAVVDPSHAAAVQLALKELYSMILYNCGVVDEKQVIDSMAALAAKYVEPLAGKQENDKGINDI